MSCDIGKATEALENELWRRVSDGKQSSFSNLSVLHLCHNSFSSYEKSALNEFATQRATEVEVPAGDD